MTIQKIGNTWHIIDKATDTVTKDNVMARGMMNALYKHIAFKGTTNPLKHTIELSYEDKALYKRLTTLSDHTNYKKALAGTRFAHIY